MTASDHAAQATEDAVVVAVFVEVHAYAFLPTLRSAFEHLNLPVVLGGHSPEDLALFSKFGLTHYVAPNAAVFINELWSKLRSDILLVADPVLFPQAFQDRAVAVVRGDLRAASLSFFSNAADFLSFPHGHPVGRPPEGTDESVVTRRLRERTPPPHVVPIATAAGSVVLLSRSALGAVGDLEAPPSGKAAATIVDFSLRARRKGLISLLDAGTFYSRPSDLALEPMGSEITPADRDWLNDRHPFGDALLEQERRAGDSPMSIAIRTAHAKVMGLRVLIDGTPLGPTQMGTQTTILAIIESLARRDDVAEVGVVLGSEPPRYATSTLDLPAVRARVVDPNDLSSFGRHDIGHRPFQPDQALSIPIWRGVCDRFLLSVLDVIGYQIGSYYVAPHVWLEYRQVMRDALSLVDGVTVISDDVRTQLRLEQLPVDDSRVFVVPYGTEHLAGDEVGRMPDELARRGDPASEFLLCLGTTYSHKNRDLAIRAYRELRSRGWNLRLILAGAFVPYGSSRVLESLDVGSSDGVIVLPDIPEEERNWLLRHASVVLYPTSAEGFGLVPFEAARFGTPTVHVDFGPLLEFSGGHLPVVALAWTPSAFADAVESVLRDPALASEQVRTVLKSSQAYSWDRTADLLTTAYRSLVAMPPRLPEGLPIPSRPSG